MVENAAEPRTPTNPADRAGRWRTLDQLVLHPLVIPPLVRMRRQAHDLEAA